MNPPFPFESMLAFGFLSVMLLIGMAARAWIKPLQRFLFPSCLVGGIIGMLLVNLDLAAIDPDLLETFAYHFFNISFISVGLTGNKEEEEKEKGKVELVKGPLWMALVQCVTFPVQGLMGGLIVILLGLAGIELFSTFGFFAPLGFTEGPGQALSFGRAWEEVGFTDASTIGITFASVGFFFAFFVGVPLANWGIRKGAASHGDQELSPSLLKGIMGKNEEKEPAGELTVHSANLETLAFQTGLIGLVYIICYLLTGLVAGLLGPEESNILWGFFFIFGLGVAILVKSVMGWLGMGHLIDPGVQRRITGWSVDFLITATVSAIKVAVVWAYIIPIALICIVDGVITTLLVLYFGRRTKPHGLEKTLAIYGTVTGTVSSGLLLLRIVDPEFKTPVALELALMNIFAIPIILAGVLLANSPVLWEWDIIQPMALYGAMALVGVILLKVLYRGEKHF